MKTRSTGTLVSQVYLLRETSEWRCECAGLIPRRDLEFELNHRETFPSAKRATQTEKTSTFRTVHTIHRTSSLRSSQPANPRPLAVLLPPPPSTYGPRAQQPPTPSHNPNTHHVPSEPRPLLLPPPKRLHGPPRSNLHPLHKPPPHPNAPTPKIRLRLLRHSRRTHASSAFIPKPNPRSRRSRVPIADFRIE